MYKVLTALSALIVFSACDSGAIAPVDSSSAVQPSQAALTAANAQAADNHQHDSAAKSTVSYDTGEKYVAGKDYRVLSRPIPTANPNKVEVAEFFWYGCGHCYSFEPAIQEYKKNAPDFVDVVPVPTMWRSVMDVHAKAYYAAKTLKKPELHEALFKALNANPRGLNSTAEVAKLFAKHGVDEQKALKTLSSFGVKSQVQKAKSLAGGAKISGTPTLVVNGKYVVETRLAGSQRRMLQIADYLAKKEK